MYQISPSSSSKPIGKVYFMRTKAYCHNPSKRWEQTEADYFSSVHEFDNENDTYYLICKFKNHNTKKYM